MGESEIAGIDLGYHRMIDDLGDQLDQMRGAVEQLAHERALYRDAALALAYKYDAYDHPYVVALPEEEL